MRDGLQSIDTILKTEEKLFILSNIIRAGFRDIEVTSFSNPNIVPQFYDAEELCIRLPSADGVRFWALAPNLTGYKRASFVGVENISLVISASNTHNVKNLNSTLGDKISEIKRIISTANNDGINTRVYISTCFECPYEGIVPEDTVLRIANEVLAAGASCVAISDTIGTASIDMVDSLLSSLFSSGVSEEHISMHMHDIGGSSVDNIIKSIELGITNFDSAFGGIGGCPFSNGKGATNADTISIYNAVSELGIETNLNRGVFDVESMICRYNET
jgi:hydroxymethylglutaryl-CoA lyase